MTSHEPSMSYMNVAMLLAITISNLHPSTYIDGILPKGPYPPCLRMADRALLAGYPRYEGDRRNSSFHNKVLLLDLVQLICSLLAWLADCIGSCRGVVTTQNAANGLARTIQLQRYAFHRLLFYSLSSCAGLWAGHHHAGRGEDWEGGIVRRYVHYRIRL